MTCVWIFHSRTYRSKWKQYVPLTGVFPPPSTLNISPSWDLDMMPCNDTFCGTSVVRSVCYITAMETLASYYWGPWKFSGFCQGQTVWAQIFIKGVKSSNGTFTNGEQLSPEGHQSKPHEPKPENIIVCNPIQLVYDLAKNTISHLIRLGNRNRLWVRMEKHSGNTSPRKFVEDMWLLQG